MQYILTTNAASLYSVVIYGRGLTDDGGYIRKFRTELREHLEEPDLCVRYERAILPNSGEVTLAKTADRSVLGSMNDMVSLCKHTLRMEEKSPWDLSKALNDTPFKATGYRFPRGVFASIPAE